MRRALILTALLAMGLFVASSVVMAQEKPAESTAGGTFTLDLLGRSDVASSKFQEYREIPKGVSIPFMNLFATNSTVDFNLIAQHVARSDQRYTGWANFNFVGIGFDYNQTPHNMGNDARVIWNETNQGEWSLSQTLRQAIAASADATPSAGRTYPYYQTLLSPTFADANTVNLSALRQRGAVDFDFSQKLPFNLDFTYMRELKSGYRGQAGGDILGSFSPVVDVPAPLNEITQDYGVRLEYPLKANKLGNVHASFNRNTYDNRAESLRVDNPFRPVDVAYTTATSNPGGGPATALFSTAPDNSANTTKVGVFLKFKKQTRVSADVSMASWNQNAAFLPYGSNTTVFTPSGQNASLTASLQQPSFNGKIDTTTLNFGFVSRPVEGLGIRIRYRTYDLTNKTARYVITGDESGSPDRSWSPADAPNAEAPYGHGTAIPYDTTTKVFSASASYDFKALTVEGNFRTADLSRTYREATSGRDSGGGLAA
ncbi:MAG: MtrB/PioB family outer membrane beta-barrel protein, partial [Bacteroidales bacterium]